MTILSSPLIFMQTVPKKFLAVLALCCAALYGCAPLQTMREPPRRTFEVNGAAYSIGQLTESTWTAIPVGSTTPATDATQQTALTKAIETVSGCKVTDIGVAAHGAQFSAQVQCPAKVGN